MRISKALTKSKSPKKKSHHRLIRSFHVVFYQRCRVAFVSSVVAGVWMYYVEFRVHDALWEEVGSRGEGWGCPTERGRAGWPPATGCSIQGDDPASHKNPYHSSRLTFWTWTLFCFNKHPQAIPLTAFYNTHTMIACLNAENGVNFSSWTQSNGCIHDTSFSTYGKEWKIFLSLMAFRDKDYVQKLLF